MAEPRRQPPLLLVVAAFSRHPEALGWGREHLERRFGPVVLASPPYAFDQTCYYQPTMGPDLRKQLFAFQDLVPADSLPDLKASTNTLEQELARSGTFPEPRPLNLDPGVLALGKFLLATMKDHAHRVYLRDGVFAEVTLHFRGGQWRPWPWTFADYRLPEVLAFLTEARDLYRRRLDETRAREAPLG